MLKWLTNHLVKGYVQATKFITTGGTSSDFVKGDGSLDDNSYATETYVDTEIDDSIDAVEIGGRNLTRAFDVEDSSALQGYWSKPRPIYYDDIYDYVVNTAWGLQYEHHVLQKGIYTVSVYAKLHNSGSSETISEVRFSSTGGNWYLQGEDGNDYVTHEWKRFSLTVYISQDYTQLTYYILDKAKSQSIRFAKVKFEKGNKITDWSPAPEDQITDWNQTTPTAFNYLKNKPTKLSDFTNDGFATESWANSNFDNYQSWNLKTNGIQRTAIQSGDNLDLVAGTNIGLSYGAGGQVTINSSFNDTTYSAGTGLDLTGTEFSFDTAWGDGRYALDSGVIHTNSTSESKDGKLTINNDFEVTGKIQSSYSDLIDRRLHSSNGSLIYFELLGSGYCSINIYGLDHQSNVTTLKQISFFVDGNTITRYDAIIVSGRDRGDAEVISDSNGRLWLKNPVGVNYTTAKTNGSIKIGEITDGSNITSETLVQSIPFRKVATRQWVQSQNYLQTETDPTVPSHVKDITTGDISNWDGKENAFTKNTAFNKNFGTSSGTVVEGDDGRLHTHSNKSVLDGISVSDVNNWDSAFDKKVTGITVTGTENKVITITREDGTTIAANLTDISYPNLPDDVINTLTFTSSTGELKAITSEGISISASIDGRYSLIGHSHTISDINNLQNSLDNKEPKFTKNSAFNKNFGTSSGTVAEGNDSRINNGQTAYEWGDFRDFGTLYYRGTIDNGDDMNNLEAGYYLISSSIDLSQVLNFPTNYISSSGNIVVEVWYTGGYITQKIHKREGASVIRTSTSSGNFEPWKKFWLDTDFTQTNINEWNTALQPADLNGYATESYVDNNIFSGNYNDLSNKPTIPTNNNQLTNGKGYITSSALPTVNNNTITINTQGILTDGGSFTLNQGTNETLNITAPSFGTSSGTVARGNDSRFHSHSNKSILDGISSSDVSNWNDKQDKLLSGTIPLLDSGTDTTDRIWNANVLAVWGINSFIQRSMLDYLATEQYVDDAIAAIPDATIDNITDIPLRSYNDLQDKLTAGDGISISGSNVISSTVESLFEIPNPSSPNTTIKSKISGDALGNGQIVIGRNASTDTGYHSIAIGSYAKVSTTSPGAIAIGQSSNSSHQSSIALGTSSKTFRISEVSLSEYDSQSPTNNKYVAGVRNPEFAYDAANKDYVDQQEINYIPSPASTVNIDIRKYKSSVINVTRDFTINLTNLPDSKKSIVHNITLNYQGTQRNIQWPSGSGTNLFGDVLGADPTKTYLVTIEAINISLISTPVIIYNIAVSEAV